MFRVILFILIILTTSQSALAQRHIKRPISAARGDRESFRQAFNRNVRQHSRSFKKNNKVTDFATQIFNLKTNQIPNLSKEQHLKALSLFKFARDKRVLTDKNGNKRRLPWLYPKDGCFDRADAVKNIFSRSKIPIKKIFSFGELRAKNPFTPRGYVTWWYHVAAAYKYQGNIFIIDPALFPYKPIMLNDWIAKQTTKPESVTISICHKNSVSPSSRCHNPQIQSGAQLTSSLQRFLTLEENNLIKLGYDSQKELGPSPYWMRSQGLVIPSKLANFFKLVESFQ